MGIKDQRKLYHENKLGDERPEGTLEELHPVETG